MTRSPIYLDNHATTPIDKRVLEAMMPYLTERFGNAASTSHSYGWAAEAAVDVARERIATAIGARPNEIVFTSGATEANNLAIQGIARAATTRGRHIITSVVEHKAVLDVCQHVAGEGWDVSQVVPNDDGTITPQMVCAQVRPDTVLVSLMAVNNEIGVVAPLAAIVAAVKQKNPKTLFHCDAAQALGRIGLNVAELGIGAMSLSAHKVYGPQGIGALWIRRRPRLAIKPVLFGGGHEQGLRPGTLPVPSIVGFGRAAELAVEDLRGENARIEQLRERLRTGISSQLDGVYTNGTMVGRVAGNLNLSFAGVDGEALLMAMRDIAVSSGSACTSASRQPSYVLKALGVSKELAHASVRFGLGRFTTADDIERAIECVVSSVQRLRAATGQQKGAGDGVKTAVSG